MTFSEIEKINIKNQLIANCERSWATYGFKKTNVDELCRNSGISKGAFYLFYKSKEDLFVDVMITVQERLVAIVAKEIGENPTKFDLIRTLKRVHKELIEIPFLIETKSSDFITFINKLSPDKLKELEAHNSYDMRDVIRKSGLKYKADEEAALAALAFIFMPIPKAEQEFFTSKGTVDFMIDILVDKLFV